MKVRRTLRSLGEGGWKGFGEFRKDTSELCSEELHSGDPIHRLNYSAYVFEKTTADTAPPVALKRYSLL